MLDGATMDVRARAARRRGLPLLWPMMAASLVFAACGASAPPPPTPAPEAAAPHWCDEYMEAAMSFDRIARLASVQFELRGAVLTLPTYETTMQHIYESLPPGGSSTTVSDYLSGAYNEFRLAAHYAHEGDEGRALEAARTWRRVSDFAIGWLTTGGCGG